MVSLVSTNKIMLPIHRAHNTVRRVQACNVCASQCQYLYTVTEVHNAHNTNKNDLTVGFTTLHAYVPLNLVLLSYKVCTQFAELCAQ